MKSRTESFSLSYTARLCIEDRDYFSTLKGEHLRWIDGTVRTEYGIAEVMSQGHDGNGHPYARVDFIWKGRHWIRTWQRAYTKFGLARLAHRFAREVAGGGRRATG